MLEELIVDVRGDADPATPGEGLGVFVGQKRTPDFERAAAASMPVAVHACEHLLEHRIEEHRLEFLRSGFRLGLCDRGRVLRSLLVAELARWSESGRCDHYITSISAWIAPAALIACRMV